MKTKFKVGQTVYSVKGKGVVTSITGNGIYPIDIDIESTKPSAEFEVVWQPEEVKEKEDKYKVLEAKLTYGDFTSHYTKALEENDYTSAIEGDDYAGLKKKEKKFRYF